MPNTALRAGAAFAIVFVLAYALIIAGDLLSGIIASVLILLLVELRRRNNLKKRELESVEAD
jgi:hypothetical protein